MSEYLMTVSSEFESEVIRERLAEAGIEIVVQGQANPRAYIGGERAVYVEARDLERAREVLADAEDIDEDELARLSQEAVEKPAADS